MLSIIMENEREKSMNMKRIRLVLRNEKACHKRSTRRKTILSRINGKRPTKCQKGEIVITLKLARILLVSQEK